MLESINKVFSTDEILANILAFLPIKTRIGVARTNRDFNAVVNDDLELKKYFPDLIKQPEILIQWAKHNPKKVLTLLSNKEFLISFNRETIIQLLANCINNFDLLTDFFKQCSLSEKKQLLAANAQFCKYILSHNLGQFNLSVVQVTEFAKDNPFLAKSLANQILSRRTFNFSDLKGILRKQPHLIKNIINHSNFWKNCSNFDLKSIALQHIELAKFVLENNHYRRRLAPWFIHDIYFSYPELFNQHLNSKKLNLHSFPRFWQVAMAKINYSLAKEIIYYRSRDFYPEHLADIASCHPELGNYCYDERLIRDYSLELKLANNNNQLAKRIIDNYTIIRNIHNSYLVSFLSKHPDLFDYAIQKRHIFNRLQHTHLSALALQSEKICKIILENPALRQKAKLNIWKFNYGMQNKDFAIALAADESSLANAHPWQLTPICCKHKEFYYAILNYPQILSKFYFHAFKLFVQLYPQSLNRILEHQSLHSTIYCPFGIEQLICVISAKLNATELEKLKQHLSNFLLQNPQRLDITRSIEHINKQINKYAIVEKAIDDQLKYEQPKYPEQHQRSLHFYYGSKPHSNKTPGRHGRGSQPSQPKHVNGNNRNRLNRQ